MGVVDQVVGALMIGSWTNTALYTLELMGMWRYFRTYTNDHWFLKSAVGLALLSDTVGTITNCVCVYRYAIVNFGNMAALGLQGFEFPVYLTTSTISAAICQWYLIHRYWRLSKNTLVSILLIGVSLTAKGCALYTDYALTAFSSLSQRGKLVTSATTWLSCEFAADVLIATALIIYLSSYTKDSFSGTRSVLYRLIFLAAESGSFTTVLAVAALATFLTAQQTNTCVGIAWNLGRAYSLTLLLNLGIRKHSGSSSGSNSKSFSFPLSTVKSNKRGGDFEGVTIDYQTQIHVEDDSNRDGPVAVTFDSDDKSSSHKAHM